MSNELGDQRIFKVVLCRSIWDGRTQDESKNFATMTRDVQLPFPPSAGLQLCVAADMPRDIARVRYDIEAERFVCHFEDEFINVLDLDALEFDELIADGIEWGWKHVSTVSV